MNFYIDVFPLDQMNPETLVSLEMLMEMEKEGQRSGPCEDDMESTTELMLYLPEESLDHEYGSPLSFNYQENHRLDSEAFIDEQIQEAYRLGY